jgi:hypothetical protein
MVFTGAAPKITVTFFRSVSMSSWNQPYGDPHQAFYRVSWTLLDKPRTVASLLPGEVFVIIRLTSTR